MVGNLVSGKRIAQASGRDLGQTDDNDQVRHTHTLYKYIYINIYEARSSDVMINKKAR